MPEHTGLNLTETDMTMKSTILAAVLGFATISAGQAASPASVVPPSLESGVAQVRGDGGQGGGRGGGGGYGDGQDARSSYVRGKRPDRRWYRPFRNSSRCHNKRFRVWSHRYDGWVYQIKTVCYRRGHRNY